MENQHRKIKGYRELSQAEIDLMNAIKEKAAEVGELCERLTFTREQIGAAGRLYPEKSDAIPDQRWVAIGTTDLQKGFMALTRSVAKPGFF